MGQLLFSGNYKDQIIMPRSWDWCWWVGRGRGHRHHSKSHGRAAVQALRPREALLHPSTSLGNDRLRPLSGWSIRPTARMVEAAFELNPTPKLLRRVPGLEHGHLGKRWRSAPPLRGRWLLR